MGEAGPRGDRVALMPTGIGGKSGPGLTAGGRKKQRAEIHRLQFYGKGVKRLLAQKPGKKMYRSRSFD